MWIIGLFTIEPVSSLTAYKTTRRVCSVQNTCLVCMLFHLGGRREHRRNDQLCSGSVSMYGVCHALERRRLFHTPALGSVAARDRSFVRRLHTSPTERRPSNRDE